MIEASIDPIARRALDRDLSARAASRGRDRSARLKQALRNADHRWHSAAALWPDLGPE